MAYSHNAPFRADVVGSYLRPAELKAAREDFAAGKIDAAALKAVEDKAITELVAKQKAAGLHVITDGEFRRGWWHFDFMWGFNGVDHAAAAHRVAFHDEVTPADTATVTGRISGENHPFVEHFKFVKVLEGEGQVARQTIPAPIQTFSEVTLDRCDGQQESLRAVYKTDEELADAIAAAYRTVIADLYAAGCRNIQFDDCTWGIYCDTDFVAKTGMSPVDLQKVSELGVALNNAAIADKPDDLVINTHVCRGNYHSTYAFEGGYDPVAPYLFANENVEEKKFASGNQRFLNIKHRMYANMAGFHSVTRFFDGIMYIAVVMVGALFLISDNPVMKLTATLWRSSCMSPRCWPPFAASWSSPSPSSAA